MDPLDVHTRAYTPTAQVMDMLALGVSAGLTWLCRNLPRGGLLLPALAYPICSAGEPFVSPSHDKG
jgi:hypothetical protein